MEITTPDWVKHAIFYQIFPDRFAKSTKSPFSDSRWESWDSPPTIHGYKGGDFWGILEKLDYLIDLGITAIYFTPIFQSPSNHRYHTHDYYQVDPILGGNEAFLSFLEAAHQANIKVVLDGVFNHASRGFFYFNDILENGPQSPWIDWFKIKKWPLSPYDGTKPANYEAWWGLRALPVFNHDNPEVQEYIWNIAEYWLKLGIDGWRLDVPAEITTPGFWQEFRRRVKAINPDAYIVGEIWTDATQWLDGTQFDGVMNYQFAVPTIAFTGGDRVNPPLVSSPDFSPYPAIDAATYAHKIQTLLNRHPINIQQTQLNLLDSHDTARLTSIVDQDETTLELCTLLLFTFPGAPSIYYGDEVGLPGKKDPDSRRGFPPPDQWNQKILNYHKQLIKIRKQYPALRIGNYQILFAIESVYIFSRTLSTSELIIAVNVGTTKAQIKFNPLSNSYKIIYGTTYLTWDAGYLILTLPPRQGTILESTPTI